MAALSPMATVAVAALLVTACTGEIMTSQLHRPNSDGFFRYSAGRGEMLAVIVGNPFPVSKDVLDQDVTEAMLGNHNGPPTRFSTDPGPAADRHQRIVVAFDTPANMHARALCGDPAAIPTNAPEAGKTRASVAFCVESDLYSEVNIHIPAVGSPADPRFRRMIASAMWELIPSRDPLTDNNMCFGADC